MSRDTPSVGVKDEPILRADYGEAVRSAFREVNKKRQGDKL
jgi:hypothetical protein